MSVTLPGVVGVIAYQEATAAGTAVKDARQHAGQVERAAKERIDEAVDQAFRHVHWKMKLAVREAARLRSERDALLACLADALGTTVSTAWQIARLELHNDREERDA